MSQLPLVTVGILSYNNSKYLYETLQSVANQSYKNTEIIIHDDASTDNSIEIIKSWIDNNLHLKVYFIASKKNLGVCKSLNKVISLSNGKYICTIGSDDMYLPQFIEKRVQFLKNTDETVGLCYSWSYIINETRKEMIKERRGKNPSGYIFDQITEGVSSLCKPFTMLVKRDVYLKDGLFDETLYYEDLDWFLRVSKKHQILFYDSYDTIYRELQNSLGTKLYSTENGILSQLRIIEKNIGYSKVGDRNLDKRFRALIVRSHQSFPNLAFEISKKRLEYFPSVEARALNLSLKLGLPVGKLYKMIRP